MFRLSSRLTCLLASLALSGFALAAPCPPSKYDGSKVDPEILAEIEKVRCAYFGKTLVGPALEQFFDDARSPKFANWNMTVEQDGTKGVVFFGKLNDEGVRRLKGAVIEHTKGTPQGAPMNLFGSLSQISRGNEIAFLFYAKNGRATLEVMEIYSSMLKAAGWPKEVYTKAFFH